MILFRLPKWTVAAVTFNNTTSLPLLLVQSLKSTGVLEGLLGSDPNFDRIRSYFLVFAVVINVLTFGEGERALTGYKEHAFPFAALLGLRKYAVDFFDTGVRKHGNGGSGSVAGDVRRESEGLRGDSDSEVSEGELADGDLEESPTQTTPLLQRRITPLLPGRLTRRPVSISRRVCATARRGWNRLPDPVKRFLHPFRPFVNSPSLGALAGVIIGLTPPLHRLFFSPMHEGGYFNAWLTTPMQNIGDLFVTLQVLVVGVSLSLSLRQRKRDKKAGDVPRRALIFVLLMRFVVLPAYVETKAPSGCKVHIAHVIKLTGAQVEHPRYLGAGELHQYLDQRPGPLVHHDAHARRAAGDEAPGPRGRQRRGRGDNHVHRAAPYRKSGRAGIFEPPSPDKYSQICYAVTPLISLPVVGALRASEAVGK